MTKDLILAIGMLGTAAMIWGGITMIVKHKDRRKGTLMLIVAAVIFANVLIVGWPA
jgi:hypothetical protein